jgi:hypothetical protein
MTTAKTIRRQLANLGLAILLALYSEDTVKLWLTSLQVEAARWILFRANKFCCIVTNAYFYFRYITLVKAKKVHAGKTGSAA